MSQPTRVLVLGAGFGGLEVMSRLSARLGERVDLTLIDSAAGFVFGFSKLDVMFGRVPEEHVVHPYAELVERPGARFVQARIDAIDPAKRCVETDAGTFDADIMVVALGADLDPSATPGMTEGGHEFYTVRGAFALRDVLANFAGGRVIIAVTSTPFKCPPAPSETALLMHDFLQSRGLRDRSSVALVMPLPRPIPPSPAASEALLAAFAERDIEFVPNSVVRGLDGDRRVALVGDGEMPYDLFLGVPKHRAPDVVIASGLTVDGWIPVSPQTLETSFADVYAVGDVTSVGTPKAGVFSEGQAAIVADRIAARIDGSPAQAEYDGRGICYVEFGDDTVGRVEVTFRPGQAPSGTFDDPSAAWAADKSEFGRSRMERWFGKDWTPLG
jgi:sulfide:quinone oxidoreductase